MLRTFTALLVTAPLVVLLGGAAHAEPYLPPESAASSGPVGLVLGALRAPHLERLSGTVPNGPNGATWYAG